MHYSMCPEWEMKDSNGGLPNSDCPDCALIATVYERGYRHGAMDALYDMTDACKSAIEVAEGKTWELIRRELSGTRGETRVFT